MHQLHGARMAFFQIDACNAAVIDLTEKFTEVGATLVPYPCLRDEGCLITCFNNAIGEVDILTEAHLREATQFLIHLATDTHIIGAREELVKFLAFTSTNAACGKERRHTIGDGFLYRCE